MDGRTTRHEGYVISERKRKLVEEVFGWGKTIGGLRTLQHRAREKVARIFSFTKAAYILVRLRTLIRGGCARVIAPAPAANTANTAPDGASPSPARRTPRDAHHRLNAFHAAILSNFLTHLRFASPC